MNNKVLVVHPHIDDGFIHAGGYMFGLQRDKFDVANLVFTTESSVANIDGSVYTQEFRNACEIYSDRYWCVTGPCDKLFPSFRQQILDKLCMMNLMYKPDIVICPGSFDMHQDHHTVYEECFRAFKKDAVILGYNAPWNCRNIQYDMIIEITEEDMTRKLDMLKCFGSQNGRRYMSDDYIRSMAASIGIKIDVPYAEGFEVIRWVKKGWNLP